MRSTPLPPDPPDWNRKSHKLLTARNLPITAPSRISLAVEAALWPGRKPRGGVFFISLLTL
jgi:hypothetical protein